MKCCKRETKMAEYIEREAALRVLCDACGNAACPKGLISRCSYYEKMQSIPAADVRPVVRGKWLESKSMMEVVYCSECGFRTVYGIMPDGLGRNFSFCPNCGADMREES